MRRLINLLIITVFLFQDIGWTAATVSRETLDESEFGKFRFIKTKGDSQGEKGIFPLVPDRLLWIGKGGTAPIKSGRHAGENYVFPHELLAPISEFVKLASPIDLEMAGIGHTFIQWIEKTGTCDINQLSVLLKRNPQFQKDLLKKDIWTIFYLDRIELISPMFTLVFLDANQYPQAGLCRIADTNMRIDLYRHPRPASPPIQISIKGQKRVIVTDKSIPGLNTIPVPQGQRIAVIEMSSGDHAAYAGNFIKKLGEQNDVRFLTPDNIYSFSPDIIFIPYGHPELERTIKNIPLEFILIYYEIPEAGYTENAYLPVSDDDIQIAKRAILEYKSQVERTPYHEIAELSAMHNGSKIDTPYAHAFVSTSIVDGVLTEPDLTQVQNVSIIPGAPLISISPHIDDMAIKIPGLVRSKLRDTTPSSTGVVDFVFTYSERGVLGEGTLEEKRAIRVSEDTNAKRILEEGTYGLIQTEYLGFDFKDESGCISRIEQLLERYMGSLDQGITVALPHPLDSHPTHRKTTKITIEALKRISREKKVRFNLLFYRSPWSGDYNTFYASGQDLSGDKTAGLQKQLCTRTVGELAGVDFAGKTPSPEELGGGFTERFRRSRHILGKYIGNVDDQKLDTALSDKRLLQSHSGIRINYAGTGDALSDEDKIIACLYAYNYVRFIYENITQATGESPVKLTLVTGHDPRPTAGALMETQIRGFLAAAENLGIEVEIINLGLAPKPMYQNAVRSFQANGGVYLTASHNELSWNGLEYSTKYKIENGFTFGGALLNVEESKRLISTFSESIGRIKDGDQSIIEEINDTNPVIRVDHEKWVEAKESYKRFIEEKFGRVQGVKVVLDPNGGAACYIYKEILEELGFTVVEVNREIGKPEHMIDPEKDPLCYSRLSEIIKRENALLGMTFDYDADRAYLVILDPQGERRTISPQDTAAVNVATVLKWCRLNDTLTDRTAIVVNDPTSGKIKGIAKRFNVEVFEVEVGETNLVNKMHELRKEGYYVPVAVEGSNGGTIFFDSMCRDGLLSTICVAMHEVNPDLSEPIPEYFTEMYELHSADIPARELKIRLEEYIAKHHDGLEGYEFHYFAGISQGVLDETGGWKAVFKTRDGKEHFIWLRASKTEPNVLRVEFDSPDEKVIQELKRLFHHGTIDSRCKVYNDLDEVSRVAAGYFINEIQRLIREKGKAVVSLATGNTQRRMYKIIREEYRDAVDWSKVITFNLDEYVFPEDKAPLINHPQSFRYFMEEELFRHIPIPRENIHFLNGTHPNIEEFKHAIAEHGGIDLCILGIGQNGHTAFNEPGSSFTSTTRIAELSSRTRFDNRHAFGGRIEDVPRYALTMGISEIMASRKIMLLASGKAKADAVGKAVYGEVTEDIPASILQTHPNVKYFVDRDVLPLPKSYTDKGGGDKEANRAQDVTDEEITKQAKAILLEDERFREKDREFIASIQQARVIVVPDLSLDGHYGMGGEINQHTLPAIYVPKGLYEYLMKRHNKGDPDVKTELADYLYSKYVEMRLIYLYGMSAREKLPLYYEIRELLNSYALEFVKWVLKSYPPGSGKRYLAICQQGANPLGIMLKAAIEKLGWTHLEVKDIYVNTSIAGDRHYEIGVGSVPEFDTPGNNTDEEIFRYLYQQGLLDGSPITFIDTGMYGSIPWVCEKAIDNAEFWKGIGQEPRVISMEAKLLFYNYLDGSFYIDEQGRSHRVGGHTHPIKSFDDSMDVGLMQYTKVLEYDFPRIYQRPHKLVERDGRLDPDLKSLSQDAELKAFIAKQAARDLVFEKIEVSPTIAFRQAVSDGIASTPPSNALEVLSSDTAQEPLVRSMAWHVLAGIGMDAGFKGRVVYSLKALLESDLNDRDEMVKLKALVQRTKGKVFFYAGDSCRGSDRYDFLKDSIVTKATVGSRDLTIFMLDIGDMAHLGLDKTKPGRLAGNQFIVPVEGTRDVEDDILLGFELVRNNGDTKKLPSLFKSLLAEAVREWLKANGKSHDREDIEQILQIAVPETKGYLGDIEHARQILVSS